jgi:Neuraminidase (sialidase)
MRACALTVLILCLAASAFAGWDPAVRLTASDSATHNSMTPARSVAAGPPGCVHVIFYDNRTGDQQIYYKRSADSGSTWSADTLLSNGAGLKGEPAVAASGGCVHAVWEDRDSGYNAGIRYRRSTDAGLTWLAETLLASTANNCRNPSVGTGFLRPCRLGR